MRMKRITRMNIYRHIGEIPQYFGEGELIIIHTFFNKRVLMYFSIVGVLAFWALRRFPLILFSEIKLVWWKWNVVENKWNCK